MEQEVALGLVEIIPQNHKTNWNTLTNLISSSILGLKFCIGNDQTITKSITFTITFIFQNNKIAIKTQSMDQLKSVF